ncbi:MAG: Holliday junction resolvase RuvX [Gammaproteobacteria bacterium]|nr:Holliday junction resolvase RuvX [Gammaproteobacteria bacterium]
MSARTLLAFDYGRQRIGIAVGQEITHSSTPLTTVHAINHKPDWDKISKLIQEWQPDALVVGIPLQMDGKEQEMSKAARKFSRQLEGRYRLPIFEADERLSSREAQQQIKLGRQSGTRGRSQKGDVDKIAASVILQRWLDGQVTL